MRCCVYVGYTSRSPQARLAQHLDPPQNFKATVVTKCGGTLRPELASGLVFRTKEEAIDAEASQTAYLKDRGYTAFGDAQPR